MINTLRINESVLAEMRRAGVGRKTDESKMSELDLERQEKAIKAKAEKAKAEKSKSVKESMSSMRAGIDKKLADEKSARQEEIANAPGLVGILRRLANLEDSELLKLHTWIGNKITEKQARDIRSYKAKGFLKHINNSHGLSVKEGEDEKEGLEDKQFDAPTGSEINDLDKKNAGIDQGHDEASEEQDDPTREKLETPQDEADEQKGGAAELAADLRVSVRIERMNMGRYKKMLDKHDLSEDGQGWLKEKIQDIQSMIDDMLERIPQLEKEAEEQEGGAEEAQVEIKEHMKVSLRKAIVEIAG